MTADQVIAAYLQLRANKEETVKRHKEELAPLNDSMDKCLAWIQRELQAQGLTNLKGQSGIAFLQTDTSVTVKDREAFMDFITKTNQWSLLDARASKSVVQDFIEANGEAPPGVKVTLDVCAHIRKS